MSDPLQLIVQCLVSDTPLTAAFSDNPDVRASLRLFDPAYIDTLGAIHGHRQQIKSRREHPSSTHKQICMQAIGCIRRTRVLEKLLSEDPSPQQNALLADCLVHTDDPGILARVNETTLGQLFAKVEAQEDLDKGLCLLFAAARIPPGPWLRHLLVAVCQGILGSCDAGVGSAQLLCLLALILENYGAAALDLMASLDCLRQLARQVIKLLSQPLPTVAAAALHLLTRLLLPPQQALSLPAKPSPLTILADSLRGKLFDESHIARTILLAADLCLNCSGQDPSELLILDAVAGTIACIALHGGSEFARLFELTELAPAIVRLVALARENRRYLHPLLRILNPLLSDSSKTDSPLINALTADSDSEGSSGSAIAEVFDIALSGIEDALCTVPTFGGSRSWPRVSSDECSGGWLISCNRDQRAQLTMFLARAIGLSKNRNAQRPIAHGYNSIFCEELAGAIGRVVEIGVVDNEKRRSEGTAGFLGTYYWVVRPVLEIAGDLVEQSSVFACTWAAWMRESEHLGAWAMHVCGSVVGAPQTLLGDAMHEDMVEVLSQRSDLVESGGVFGDISESTGTSGTSGTSSASGTSGASRTAAIAGTAGTAGSTGRMQAESSSPLPSARSSSVKSQQAIAGSVPHAEKQRNRLQADLVLCDNIQAAVMMQWARVSEARVALALLHTVSSSPLDPDPQLQQLASILSKATYDLYQQSAGNFQHLFMGHAAMVHQRQVHCQAMLTLRHDQQTQHARHLEYCEQAEAEMNHLRGQLDQASVVFEQLCGLQKSLEQQKEVYEELAQEYRRSERDAEEWKQECIETRGLLETARKDVERLRDAGERDMRAFQKYREEAGRTECSLRSSVGMLENALAEAVARLRVLEIQNLAERNATEELRVRNVSMSSHLAEYSKIAESLYSLAQNTGGNAKSNG